MNNSIFVNLPIENLGKSVEFFSELGFTFNPHFTSEDTTCMIVGENIFVMLLENARFSTFVDNPIAARNSVEALIATGSIKLNYPVLPFRNLASCSAVG